MDDEITSIGVSKGIEEIELSRPGIRAGEFESLRVSQYVFVGNNYMTNKKLEKCPA